MEKGVISVTNDVDMDQATLRLHLAKRHPGVTDFTRVAHRADHRRREGHYHVPSEYNRNHSRVKWLFGSASNYQCLLCFDPARDWAWLWRTHPDPTDPGSYRPMCRQDHRDYDSHRNLENVLAEDERQRRFHLWQLRRASAHE
jgi:hypothetical protein